MNAKTVIAGTSLSCLIVFGAQVALSQQPPRGVRVDPDGPQAEVLEYLLDFVDAQADVIEALAVQVQELEERVDALEAAED